MGTQELSFNPACGLTELLGILAVFGGIHFEIEFEVQHLQKLDDYFDYVFGCLLFIRKIFFSDLRQQH